MPRLSPDSTAHDRVRRVSAVLPGSHALYAKLGADRGASDCLRDLLHGVSHEELSLSIANLSPDLSLSLLVELLCFT
jgi:hypothetical protein